MLALLLSLWLSSAAAQDLGFNYNPSPKASENPAFLVTPARAVDELYVEIQFGDQKLEFVKRDIAAGSTARFEWKRDTSAPHVEAYVLARFEDGSVSEQMVPMDFNYGTPLKVDLSRASADLRAKTVTVSVTSAVTSADIIAYGAGKTLLDKRTVTLRGGPGSVTIPFVGDPSDVVLLDVTLHSDSAWAGFTFSPWILNIPHEDVLFPSDSATIPADEEWKMQATLKQLNEVVEKYGSMVPIKLYIAGCTDTVGDAAHNMDLSRRRAQAIATWLRAHGFDKPIYYHGFGESLLAVQTGDNVDNQANRRAVYVVAANAPPSGSGIPSASWTEL